MWFIKRVAVATLFLWQIANKNKSASYGGCQCLGAVPE